MLIRSKYKFISPESFYRQSFLSLLPGPNEIRNRIKIINYSNAGPTYEKQTII